MKEDIFDEISAECNYIDRDTVRSVYYALIKVISRKLRIKSAAMIPDWGRFYLHRHSPRMSLDVNSGTFKSLEAKTTVKFTPDYKVKKYFYEIWTK